MKKLSYNGLLIEVSSQTYRTDGIELFAGWVSRRGSIIGFAKCATQECAALEAMRAAQVPESHRETVLRQMFA